jgi:hypothetical protein
MKTPVFAATAVGTYVASLAVRYPAVLTRREAPRMT